MSTIQGPTAGHDPRSDVARVTDIDLSGSSSRRSSSRVTFTAPNSARVFLVGPPGSGKSHILDLLSLRKTTTSGSIEVLGLDLARVPLEERPRMRRRIGQIRHDDHLLANMDIFTNVALAAIIAGRRSHEYAPKIHELLSWVGLEARGGNVVEKLSEGEKRRVCLARALINQPELIVADDPTRGLGEKAEAGFIRLIIQLNDAGTPVIYATSKRLLAARTGGAIYEF